MTRNATVVGASIAGLFTAKRVAEAGHPATIYERARSLDPTPRTLIVTDKFLELAGKAGRACVTNEVNRFELCTDGRVATIELGSPDLIIDRTRLIQDLAIEAENAGVEIKRESRFIGLEARDGAVTSLFEGPERERFAVTGSVVVGADGAMSGVARSAGWNEISTVPLLQAVIQRPADLEPDTTRVWFRPQDTPYFFWMIPEGEDRAAVGLIGEEPARARRDLIAFLGSKGWRPIYFQGARIPKYEGWVPVRKKVGKGDVYLVGDAAAQVKVTTVGGVVNGLMGSEAVASAILGARLRTAGLRRELWLHLMIRKAFHRFDQSDYNFILDHLDGARSTLAAANRDQAAAVLRRLCMSEPKVFLKGVRSLLVGERQPPAPPTLQPRSTPRDDVA